MALDLVRKQAKEKTVAEINSETKTKWQRKFLVSNTSSNDIDFLTFNNLEIGKTYRLFAHIHMDLSATTNVMDIRVRDELGNNGNLLDHIRVDETASEVESTSAFINVIFEAQTTLVTFRLSSAAEVSDAVKGSNSAEDTWAILEELPNHEVTTDWT